MLVKGDSVCDTVMHAGGDIGAIRDVVDAAAVLCCEGCMCCMSPIYLCADGDKADAFFLF